jgi:hypothetical protein
MTESGPAPTVDGAPAAEPNWWHRSHPTFAGLVGFFTGVAYVIVVPGLYATVLSLLLGDTTAQRLFPPVRPVHAARGRPDGGGDRADRRTRRLDPGQDPGLTRARSFLSAFTAVRSNAAPGRRRTSCD